MKRQVYRVEEKETRQGAYSGCIAPVALNYDFGDMSLHPTPHNDVGLYPWWVNNGHIRDAYIFGFKSLDQLFSWFYKGGDFHQNAIDTYDAVISVYEVEDSLVIDGQFQTIFHKNSSKFIKHLSFLDGSEIVE